QGVPARLHRAWRVRFRGAGACRRHQAAGQGALSAAGVRLDRILYRRAHRLQPRAVERGAVGSSAIRQRPRQRFPRRGWRRTGERYINTPAAGSDEMIIHHRLGWAAGAGVEYAFAPHWSVQLEYLYNQFQRADIRFPQGAQHSSTLDFQSLRIGLNRKVDWPSAPTWTQTRDITDPESNRWEIHGQVTYLPQGYPGFRALY